MRNRKRTAIIDKKLGMKVDDFFFFVYNEVTDTTSPVSVEDINEMDQQELEFFCDENVRKVWNAGEQEWYFSVVDVCKFLTDSSDGRKYWNKVKQRLNEEGSQLVSECHQLKLPASDGKMRATDCANTEQLLRIIQSIPSKKAEPFKMWIAQVGAERLEEMADPELTFERGVEHYKKLGYPDTWISQRIRSIEIRKELTDEWARAGTSDKIAVLTNILTQAWSGKTVQQYKQIKNLKKENLRDNMTNTELVLNQLAEISTTELSRSYNPQGFEETKRITKTGGSIAENARRDLEQKLGRSVISPINAKNPGLLDDTRKN